VKSDSHLRTTSAALAMLLVGLAAWSCSGRSDPVAGPDAPAIRRSVGLDGAPNFRDFGGYLTEDGRRVRWGTLYRSGELSDLSSSDLKRLEELGIELVVDFRSDGERSDQPSRLPDDSRPELLELPIEDEALNPSELRRRLLSGDLEGVDFSQVLVEGNRGFASRFTPQYREMLERLLKSESIPLLIHCTAGKDRTGFGAALILRILGVPEASIFDDYLLTNHFTEDHSERTLWLIYFASLTRTDRDSVRPLFQARKEYLAAAFEEIDLRYGSFDRYLVEALGVGENERAALRERLLE
jgi:protein-tyrosine phosphatase